MAKLKHCKSSNRREKTTEFLSLKTLKPKFYIPLLFLPYTVYVSSFFIKSPQLSYTNSKKCKVHRVQRSHSSWFSRDMFINSSSPGVLQNSVWDANVPGFSKSKYNISDNVWKQCDFPRCGDKTSTVVEKPPNSH